MVILNRRLAGPAGIKTAVIIQAAVPDAARLPGVGLQAIAETTAAAEAVAGEVVAAAAVAAAAVVHKDKRKRAK